MFINIPASGPHPGPRHQALGALLAFCLLTAALPAPAATLPKATPDQMLQKAKNAYDRLMKNPPKKEFRHHWLNTIDLYRLIFETRPEAPEADLAMVTVGRLYQGLYSKSGVMSDLDMALYYFRRLVKTYPASTYADDSLMALGEILLKTKQEPALAYLEFEKVTKVYPKGDKVKEAAAMQKKLSSYRPRSRPSGEEVTVPASAFSGRPSQVTSLRHWTNPSYTRVVVDVDQPARFNPNFIKEDTEAGRPRLYIDIFNASLGPKLARPITIADGLLLRARAGQFTSDTVRVVLDMAKVSDYRIFPLADPFRIVIDIHGNGKGNLQVLREVDESEAAEMPPTLSLAQQLGLGIRKIIIDPGHGGSDPGAIGVNNLQEKDITLDVCLRLSRLLSEIFNLEVLLTRKGDAYLPLEERTAIANTSRADLFVSVHCNASKKRNMRGIETYFLNLASSKEAAETAAMENMTSLARIADFEKTMVDLFMSLKIDESSRFARILQDEIFNRIKREYRDSVSLGVKQAPFVVLIGAQMPSILTEISFIDHEVEGKRLASEEYRQQMAEALAFGIGKYISSVDLVSSK